MDPDLLSDAEVSGGVDVSGGGRGGAALTATAACWSMPVKVEWDSAL